MVVSSLVLPVFRYFPRGLVQPVRVGGEADQFNGGARKQQLWIGDKPIVRGLLLVKRMGLTACRCWLWHSSLNQRGKL